MTSWIDCSLNDYFETVPMERVSYTQFISSTRERIVSHCTSETDFEDLDSVLYKRFKEKLSDHAPRSASRRFAAKKIWNAIKTSCLQEQYQLEKAQLAQHLKNDYLTLLTETREVVTDDMGDYINEHGGSSSSNSIGNNSSSIGNKRKASSKGKGKQKARHSIHQSSNVDVDNEDPFNDHTPSERARTSILKYRAGAQHVSEIHKQDLLYYGIVDLTPSSTSKFRDHMAEEYIHEIISLARGCHTRKSTLPNDVKDYAATIMDTVVDLPSYRIAIKESKQALKEANDGDSKWKRSVIRLMKHYRDTFSKDGTALLYAQQSEMNYACKFVSPILVELFKDIEDIDWEWGDHGYDVLKAEEELALKDDERRIKGSMPDGVFSLKDFGLLIALLEVSGPPNIKDNKHFVGDKIKLAKLLKKLLKNVRQQLKRQGDHQLYQRIKLYGLQFYEHKLYVYSLCQPDHGVYVFQQELCFHLACRVGFLPNFAPRYMRNLYKVKMLLLESRRSIEDYLNSDYMENSSDESCDSRDSVYISPRKKSRKPITSQIQHVQLVSATKGWGIQGLLRRIDEERMPTDDVYPVGATNVGKSALVNQIVSQQRTGSDKRQYRITSSPAPGTTMGTIRIPVHALGMNSNNINTPHGFQRDRFLVDTPGIINDQQLINLMPFFGSEEVSTTA
ncbi:predicted protein [Lichtheimia corymbifera JMRC:FSU:9682]|uniref:G domain-containing protein n=1 Tax=Lichtheimia corymbifera JMRC:FSU:9682 TaxID=1263082 RepID=A0A068S2T7_9FUNG|nr:predicted protein [Lichtheimia corymbifera JMRC:FSU:9682]